MKHGLLLARVLCYYVRNVGEGRGRGRGDGHYETTRKAFLFDGIISRGSDRDFFAKDYLA